MHASCDVAHGRRCSTSTTLITARKSCTAGICALDSVRLADDAACKKQPRPCAERAAQQGRLPAQRFQQDNVPHGFGSA